jgi:hypothetical protein
MPLMLPWMPRDRESCPKSSPYEGQRVYLDRAAFGDMFLQVDQHVPLPAERVGAEGFPSDLRVASRRNAVPVIHLAPARTPRAATSIVFVSAHSTIFLSRSGSRWP